MNTKKVFSLLLFLLGEVLLIICFISFGQAVENNILTLNIIVSTLIYCLWFIDIIIPWVNLKDKPQKAIGSIGLRWFFTFFYMLLAIGAMIYFNSFKPILFISQLIIHLVLFFLLLLGLFMAFSSSDKVKEVYKEEKQNRDRIDEMKKITKELQLKLDSLKNIPPDVSSRLNTIQDNLRFLSPSNNSYACELELKFIDEMKELSNCFYDIPLNSDKIDENIKNCERTYKERKQVFSN